MSIIKYIILGIIQGLTEFLPVSSSGHLVIFQELLGINKPGILFEIIVHLGTLAAVLIYFRRDIVKIISSIFIWGKRNNTEVKYYHNLLFFIIISTIITGVIGLLFKERLEPVFENLTLVSIMLLITGTILFISDKIKNPRKERVGWLNAVVVGISQSISILPGISRSGSTIASGLFTGLTRKLATKFSFLLSIPAILGAAILKSKELNSLTNSSDLLLPYLIAGVSAAIVGYFSIILLVKLIEKAKLLYFSIYCWTVGLILLVFMNFFI